MAERIQVNFGWLNDYSGAKFAPLTLSDKILMPDEDKTFGDYVEDNFDSFKIRLNAAEEDIDNLEKISQAVHDPLYEVTIPEDVDKEKTILDVFGANYLIDFPNGYYTLSDEDYNSDGTVKNEAKNRIINTYGISEGLDTGNNKVLPIYFKDGRPVSHAGITSLYEVGDKLLTFKEGDSLKEEWSRLEGFDINYDYVDKTDANMTQFRVNDSLNDVNALNVNIKGNARTSSIALHALQSKLAQYSYNSAIAESSKKLDYNIKFGDRELPRTDDGSEETIYAANASHIQGLIKFNNENFNGIETHPLGLRLVDILSNSGAGLFAADSDIAATSAGSYGAHQTADYNTAETLSVFNVPDISVDTTGRITNISQRAIKPGMAIKTITQYIEEDNQTARAAVIGYVGGTFVHAGALDNTGIYLDWSGGADKAILMGAAWNDYAEYRNQVETISAGYCVASQDDGKVYKTTEKFQACDGIVSDTFGFSIGRSNEMQTPLAVSGRVLAYYNGNLEDYHAGDTVCAGPEGKICKMTREEIREWPDRIIGIVSEIPTYELWNEIPTKGRIWVKVK